VKPPVQHRAAAAEKEKGMGAGATHNTADEGFLLLDPAPEARQRTDFYLALELMLLSVPGTKCEYSLSLIRELNCNSKDFHFIAIKVSS